MFKITMPTPTTLDDTFYLWSVSSHVYGEGTTVQIDRPLTDTELAALAENGCVVEEV